MKIAIPYENGHIYEDFEKATAFKIYDVKDGAVVASDIVFVDVAGKQSPVKLLIDNNVDTVIGDRYVKIAIMMLMRVGIEIIADAHGDADKAVEDYIAETLITEEKSFCSHSCGSEECDHSCGVGKE